MAYSPSYYSCPDCGTAVSRTDPHIQRIGHFNLHAGCTARCIICGVEIPKPAVGSGYTIERYCGKPAHAACKVAEAGTPPSTLVVKRATKDVELP